MKPKAWTQKIKKDIISKKVVEKIKRLISPKVFDLLSEDQPTMPKPRHAHVAIGFVDIRDFVKLTTELEINPMTIMLTEFFDHCNKYITNGNGFVDKFIGDQVMWFHEDEEEDAEKNSKNCIKVGINIIKNLDSLNKNIQEETHSIVRINVGIGLASGICTVGFLGTSKDRIQYSVIGNTANLAARLCSKAKHDELLIGGEIVSSCEHKSRFMGFQKIKGFPHKIEVRKIIIEE